MHGRLVGVLLILLAATPAVLAQKSADPNVDVEKLLDENENLENRVAELEKKGKTLQSTKKPRDKRETREPRDERKRNQSRGEQEKIESKPVTLGLDGYCLVTLREVLNPNIAWQLGNPRWVVAHKGRRYQFIGRMEMDMFLDAPDRYAPEFSCYVVVRFVDDGELVDGKRQHGVMYCGRTFVFSNEESLRKFWKNAKHYHDALPLAEKKLALRVKLTSFVPMSNKSQLRKHDHDESRSTPNSAQRD